MSIVNNSNYGFFPTHEINKNTLVYNLVGGAQWTGASVDPYKNILYVTANQVPYRLRVVSSKTSAFEIFQYRYEMDALLDLDGYPGSKPPWGTITALSLNTGKIVWQMPLGYYETLKSQEIATGTENYGGATATAGGLVFASGTLDKLIRAFDSSTGKELWSHELPFIGSAPPTSYEVNGEQYIVIPATGGITLATIHPKLVEQGDAFVAFKIQD